MVLEGMRRCVIALQEDVPGGAMGGMKGPLDQEGRVSIDDPAADE